MRGHASWCSWRLLLHGSRLPCDCGREKAPPRPPKTIEVSKKEDPTGLLTPMRLKVMGAPVVEKGRKVLKARPFDPARDPRKDLKHARTMTKTELKHAYEPLPGCRCGPGGTAIHGTTMADWCRTKGG